ncbi:nicotinamide N-methyltransferase-like isoform X2 [Pleurodeles waltl]|uniref:nicotinamide N-methyltransferase-like isoform X2 n=1 Tax=Pleurodeles waltl TaxID=8319 RepID=UPI0037094CC7
MEPSASSTKNCPDEFDPQDYLKAFYTYDPAAPLREDYVKKLLLKLHRIFSSGVNGNLLLDIGSGPTIYQHLSACEAFREIIVADFSAANLCYYEKTLKNEPGTHNWTPLIKFVCELDGNSGKLVEKREKLRSVVKQVLKCDVTKSNPFDPIVVPQADCILTFECLSSASKDLDSFRQIVKNISSFLKIGGYLLFTDALGCTKYLCGDKWLPVLNLNDKLVREIITESGFLIEEHEVFTLENCEADAALCDYNSVLFLLARKKRDI